MINRLPNDVLVFLRRCFESGIAPIDLWANDLLHKYDPPVIVNHGIVTETWSVPMADETDIE